jgi:hypothetical protein
MTVTAVIPAPTRSGLAWKLIGPAKDRWPQVARVKTRFRGGFAYVDAELADGDAIKLCRLRHSGSAPVWGFAIRRASHDGHQDSWLPSGSPSGSPEDAPDAACGLYLGDPAARAGLILGDRQQINEHNH